MSSWIKRKYASFEAFCKRQNWEDFSMNFFSVFLGIVLTFWGEALITRYNEQQDVKSALKLVRDELRDNIVELKDVNEHLELERDAAHYLMQYYDRFEECDADSMRLYCNAPLQLARSNISDEALELLKNSSLFQKISDKVLALDIIRAYKRANSLKDSFDYFNSKKERLIDEALQEKAKAVFASQGFSAAEMWTALSSTVEGKQFLHEITISVNFGFGYEEGAWEIEQVIEKIDEYVE